MYEETHPLRYAAHSQRRLPAAAYTTLIGALGTAPFAYRRWVLHGAHNWVQNDFSHIFGVMAATGAMTLATRNRLYGALGGLLAGGAVEAIQFCTGSGRVEPRDMIMNGVGVLAALSVTQAAQLLRNRN
ncbi:MAG: hypothetical protein OXR66_05185 [Candidatus Woesearchaeota archaeon]|nr:hypothetical protein [Candidatus Woesearchaeota archaeon]